MLAQPAVAFGQIEFVGKRGAVFLGTVLHRALLRVGGREGLEVARIKGAVGQITVRIDRDVDEVGRIQCLMVQCEVAPDFEKEILSQLLLDHELAPAAVLLVGGFVPSATVEIGFLGQAKGSPGIFRLVEGVVLPAERGVGQVGLVAQVHHRVGHIEADDPSLGVPGILVQSEVWIEVGAGIHKSVFVRNAPRDRDAVARSIDVGRGGGP